MSEQSPTRAVKDAVGETAQSVMDVAADAATRARDLAQDAGRRASAAAETAYGTGNDVAFMVEGAVRQNPWASLLVAAAAGYGLACLVKLQRH